MENILIFLILQTVEGVGIIDYLRFVWRFNTVFGKADSFQHIIIDLHPLVTYPEVIFESARNIHNSVMGENKNQFQLKEVETKSCQQKRQEIKLKREGRKQDWEKGKRRIWPSPLTTTNKNENKIICKGTYKILPLFSLSDSWDKYRTMIVLATRTVAVSDSFCSLSFL